MKKQASKISCSLIIYLVMLTLFVCMRIIFLQVDTSNLNQNIVNLVSDLIIQILFMFIFSIFGYSLMRKQKVRETFKEFGYSKMGIVPILVSIALGIVCYFINIYVSSFFNAVISFCGYERPPSIASSTVNDSSMFAFFLSILSIALIPAIGEETAHRGLLLHGLSPIGMKRALMLSSLMFGLMHLNINQFFYATVLGFIIGLTVIVSKNIFPAILVHFMNNFLNVYFSFARKNGWIFGKIPEKLTGIMIGGNIITFFVLSLLIISCLMLALVTLFSILLDETRVKSVKRMLIDISNIDRTYDVTQNVKNKNLINIQRINDLMKEYNIKSLNSMVFTDLESKGRRMTGFEKLLLFGIITLGSLVTVSTFVWGIL